MLHKFSYNLALIYVYMLYFLAQNIHKHCFLIISLIMRISPNNTLQMLVTHITLYIKYTQGFLC